jgi:hypothetical protein
MGMDVICARFLYCVLGNAGGVVSGSYRAWSDGHGGVFSCEAPPPPRCKGTLTRWVHPAPYGSYMHSYTHTHTHVT